MDDIVQEEKDMETGSVEKKTRGVVAWLNESRKEHPVLFYSLIIAVITTVVLAVVLIIKKCKNGKSESKKENKQDDKKEPFNAFDSEETDAEFDYINKYMEAAMGNKNEYEKLKLVAQ